MASAHFPQLFSPGRIGSLEVPNRIVKSPQTTALGNADGTVSERTIAHYRRIAEGGTGLIMVEYTYIDDDASKSIHGQLGISSPEHIAGLGRLVDTVHSYGARAGLQIEHCGRQKFLGTPPIKAPSAVPWPLLYERGAGVPSVLTIEEIGGIVGAFGDAAQRAWMAGFDLVEVHGAHGYLITNFLSPHTNTRTDLYGGTFENRTRFLRQVISDVRAKVPATFPITLRLSGSDYEPEGITFDETVAVSRLAEELGVDALHVSGGDHHTMDWQVTPQLRPLAPHADVSRLINDAVAIPVIVSGGITMPAAAEELLATGVGDFVSMGRPLLTDPWWPAKAREGRVDEIRPCIRCNEGCLDRGLFMQRAVGCSLNPSLGHEGLLDISPAGATRSVAVVGSGPAAIEAARLLRDRGHHVRVHARSAWGGGLRAASLPDFAHDSARLLNHLVAQAESLDITVSKDHDVDSVVAGVDVVVVATGARSVPATFGVAEPALVTSCRTALTEDVGTGEIVVIGGGISGATVALHLASKGASVTLIEQGPVVPANALSGAAATFPGALAERGVRVLTNTSAVEVAGAGVRIRTGLDERLIAADLVVSAIGSVPDDDVVADLRARHPDVRVIGNARQIGTIHDAIHDAHALALSV